MPASVYIGLGSNVGDRIAQLTGALAELDRTPGVRVVACSSFHETAPVGGPPDQGPFLNAAAELATRLRPHELLAVLLDVERRFGRVRSVPNGARTLDLDLLLYDLESVRTADLVVPHPRMWTRSFVLAPLAEICPPARLRAARRLRVNDAGASDDR